MALIRDYEIPGTGVTVPNAYHVVTKVDVEKRTSDILGPVDSARPDQRTVGHQQVGQEINWKAGYIGRIAVTVWKDLAARESGARPLGFIGVNPTDNTYGASISDNVSDHVCKFFIDIDSTSNHIVQAYNHLKTTAYYADSQED